jgi:hypothetical protein
MGQIAHPGFLLQSESELVSRKMPPYRRVIFSVLVGCIVATSVIAALARTGVPSSNPFDSFAYVFPGQPVGDLEAQGFTCVSDADAPDGRCFLILPTGAFSRIAAATSGGIVVQVAFTTRDDRLRVGDLIALWGRPEIDVYRRAVYLYWRSRNIFALASRHTGSFSIFLPVRMVHFFNLTSAV